MDAVLLRKVPKGFQGIGHVRWWQEVPLYRVRSTKCVTRHQLRYHKEVTHTNLRGHGEMKQQGKKDEKNCGVVTNRNSGNLQEKGK